MELLFDNSVENNMVIQPAPFDFPSPPFESVDKMKAPVVSLNSHLRTCQVCSRSIKVSSTKTGRSPTVPPICEACRKFYCRYSKATDSLLCSCTSSHANTDCRACRFQRCHKAMRHSAAERRSHFSRSISSVVTTMPNSHVTPVTPESDGQDGLFELTTSVWSAPNSVANQSRLDFSKIPCKICGVSSSGIHFGVVSCEGCKGFFRRSMRGAFRLQYRCKQTEKSTPDAESVSPKVPCPQTSNCRKCRLKRCVDAGMSQTESAIGRLNRTQRRQLDETIVRLASQHAALDQPVLRRTKRAKKRLARDEQLTHDSPSSSTSSIHDEIKAEPRSEGDSESDLKPTLEEVEMLGIPPLLPPAEKSNSLEWSLTPSPFAYPSTSPRHLIIDSSTIAWLIDRAAGATARLAPISNCRVVAPRTSVPENGFPPMEFLIERSRSFDVYIRAISDFVTHLPGISHFSIRDRVALFSNGFFPLLIAQLSLQFDASRQVSNHFSLDRDSGTFQMVGSCNSWQHLIERFLCLAGNQLTGAISNLRQYAIVCALLVFNPDVTHIEDRARLQTVHDDYMAALERALLADGQCAIGRLLEVIDFLRSSTKTFQCEIRGLPVHCEYFLQVASALFKDFRLQFMSNTEAIPCDFYLSAPSSNSSSGY